ncbi:MAG: hypothetical protein AB6733_12185 [Clostridiaceae bacterium]
MSDLITTLKVLIRMIIVTILISTNTLLTEYKVYKALSVALYIVAMYLMYVPFNKFYFKKLNNKMNKYDGKGTSGE